MAIVAPGAGRLLRAWIEAPWAMAMVLQMAKPSPEPLGLVLMNGSKMLSSMEVGMPAPVSAMEAMTRWLSLAVVTETVTAPSPGIASMELRRRLRNN